MSQSRITRIVTWVRVESARQIWVRHNPAGYQYYFPFTLFGIAQCSYLNRRFQLLCATSERNPAPPLLTVSLDTGHVASRFWSYTALRSPSPFPHTRPDRSRLAARPGSAPLNDLGRPALTAPGSADVPEVSPPSLPSLSPNTRTTMPGRTSPFSGESTLRHTDRDRSATWCRVRYIVNTLYMWKCNHFHSVYSTVPTIMASALGSKFRPKVVVQVWLVGPVGIDYLHIFRRLLVLIFFYKFSPNPLIGRIGKDRASAKQSLLRWPCPLPSDRAIPGLWQNLESKV